MAESFDITDISYIKRVVVGNTNPEKLQDETIIQKQMDLLNKYLNEYPKGKIIGQEKCFNILRIGEHQVVMQYIVYHIGFKRKPVWIE